MDTFSQLIVKIIQEQETIMGPIAIEQAQKINGLVINWKDHSVIISGDKKNILENLVNKYQSIFGQTSVEVCREIVHSMESNIPENIIPKLLH